jgi:ribosomal protein L29
MKAAEIKALSDEQVVHLELESERTLLTHSLRHRLGRLEDTSVLGKTRRDIARAKTEITARERRAGLNPGSLKGQHAGTFTPKAATAGETAGGGFLKGILDKPEASE